MKFYDKLFFLNREYGDGQFLLPVGEIMQISELQLEPGEEIVMHKQWCDEITYIVSGSATIYSDESQEVIGKRGIHFVKRGVQHKIVAEQDEKLRFVCIGYLPDMNFETNQLFDELLNGKKYFVMYDDGNVKTLSHLLVKECYAWDEYSRNSVNLYISQIIVTMCRILIGKQNSNQGKMREKNSANYAMYRILRHIDSEYIHINSIKDVAKQTGYNECYISHLFAEKMEISAKAYLLKKKIEHAVELLMTTEMSVEEVANYFNFSSAQSFRRAFKQYTGGAPTEIRNSK